MYAGVPSFFGLGLDDGRVSSNFPASAVGASCFFQYLKGPEVPKE